MGKPAKLATEQLRALDRLRAVRGIERFYLAGGTAVAVHLHHRTSRDLDLFSFAPDVDLSALAERLSAELPNVKVQSMTDAALRVVADEVPIDFVRYPHALLDPPGVGPAQFPVAGLRDLAAMKLAAVSQRGLRRDFWDLFAMAEAGSTLREMTDAYLAKFGVQKSDLYHVLRALTYFDDAEKEPEYPSGLGPKKWAKIKAYCRSEAPGLLDDPRAR